LKIFRVAVLLGTLSASSAFADTIDYSLSLEALMPAAPGGHVVYGVAASASEWTTEKQPFVVRLVVPPELEPPPRCSSGEDVTYDPATRVLTWTDYVNSDHGTRTAPCHLPFGVAASLAPGATLAIVGTLETSTPDPNPGNNVVTASAIVIASSDLAVRSSADVLTYRPGDEIAYTITVTNLGPHDALDVAVVDQLSPDVTVVSFERLSGPAATIDPFPHDGGSSGCYSPRCGIYVEARFPVLPFGSTATLHLVARVKSSIDVARMRNRVNVASDSPITAFDPWLANNYHDFLTTAGPHADLVLTSRRGSAVTNNEVPVVLDVSNAGPDTVNDVRVTSILYEDELHGVESVRFVTITPSQGTCSPPEFGFEIGSPIGPAYMRLDCALGVLASGARATISFAIEKKGAMGPLTSWLSPTENDPNRDNNQSQLSLNVRRRGVRK
jgi:uncharacterized repeat protein (TIGR01451 family)